MFSCEQVKDTNSDGTAKILFTSFSNQVDRDWNGNRCDQFIERECDPMFTICLDVKTAM